MSFSNNPKAAPYHLRVLPPGAISRNSAKTAPLGTPAKPGARATATLRGRIAVGSGMQPISYSRHRYPLEVIRQAVWVYLRFIGDVEELRPSRPRHLKCWL